MSKKTIIEQRHPVTDTGIFAIEKIDLRFSNGETRQYQRILGSEQGAVLVVPMLDEETLLLIREYAAGMDRYELGFPKGHIENGESRTEAANREIQEEIGYAARELHEIHSLTVAPGYLYHTTHIVLARDLYEQHLPGDEPEPMEVVPWRLDNLGELLRQPDFTEARSIAAFYIIRDWLKQHGTQEL